MFINVFRYNWLLLWNLIGNAECLYGERWLIASGMEHKFTCIAVFEISLVG